MPKCLLVSVYKHKSRVSGDVSNGGISGKFDDIMLECAEGPFDVADDDPQLCRLVAIGPHVHIEPVNGRPTPEHTIGPMSGGAFAYSSDSRFSRLVRESLPHGEFYGAVAIHDRYETPEQYEALSR